MTQMHIQHYAQINQESSENNAEYLHPVYSIPNVYLSINPGNDRDQSYTALQLDNCNNNGIITSSAETTHGQHSRYCLHYFQKKHVKVILFWTLLFSLIGSVCTGLTVFLLTKAACSNNEASHPREQQSVVTAPTISTPGTPYKSFQTNISEAIANLHEDSTGLDGRTFRINSPNNDRIWSYYKVDSIVHHHKFNFSKSHDKFEQFTFEKQPDGSFKMKSVGGGVYIFDGYTSNQNVLSGDAHDDDDDLRFIVTMETQGFYRIQTKATSRYVRMEDNHIVSSKSNIKDILSLYSFTDIAGEYHLNILRHDQKSY